MYKQSLFGGDCRSPLRGHRAGLETYESPSPGLRPGLFCTIKEGGHVIESVQGEPNGEGVRGPSYSLVFIFIPKVYSYFSLFILIFPYFSMPSSCYYKG